MHVLYPKTLKYTDGAINKIFLLTIILLCVSYYCVSYLYNINTYFYVYFSLFICNINILVYFQKYHGQLKMVTKIQKL